MKVLVAHNEIENKTNWKIFMQKVTDMLVSLDGYGITASDITFGTTRSRVDVSSVKEYDLVIAREDIDGISIGPGTVRKYFAANPNLRLILVVDKKKKSAGKLNALYEMGYYEALLSNDFKIESLLRLILNGRSKEEAYDYYGLMLYADYSKQAGESIAKETEPIPEVNKRGADEERAKQPQNKGVKQGQNTDKKPEDKVKNDNKDASKGVQKGNDNSAPKKVQTPVKDAKDSKNDKQNKGENAPKKKGKNSTKEVVEEKPSDNDTFSDTSELPMDSTYFVREGEVNEVNYPSDYPAEDEFIDEGELLSEDDGVKTFDASEYLTPVLGANVHVDAPDLDKDVPEAEIKKYIKAIEKKAFHPVGIKVELSYEDQILEEIMTYYTEQDPHWLADLESGILSKDRFSQHLWQRINTVYADLSDDDKMFIFSRFSQFMWGYDVVTPLIEDPTISDIALVAYNNIQVKRYGERYFSTITFRTPKHFKNFVQHIIRYNHVDLSDKKPDKTFMDTSTSALARMRFVYSQEYINANAEPSLVIRKVPTKKYTLEELVEYDMMDYRTAAIILEEVRKGHSIIWTGTMASGKTSQMNTYLDFIKHDQRGLVMQENEELFSNTHPLLQFQNIRPSEDGETLYDLRYLATFGLLMDLNYFMIGEIKGGEAEQFVEAVYTNTTCWGSVHSISAKDALPRIATLAVTDHFSEEEQLRKLAGGIDMVVYLNRFVVEQIVRVKGWDEKNHCPIYEDVPINIPKKKKAKSKGKAS